MLKSNEFIAELLGYDLQTNKVETTIEFNSAVLKFKYTMSN